MFFFKLCYLIRLNFLNLYEHSNSALESRCLKTQKNVKHHIFITVLNKLRLKCQYSSSHAYFVQ